MSNEKKNTENPIENVQSHDWNKERLEQLKQLMPDLFTNDGKLNINELKKVVDPNSVNETERYEFRWFGKSKAKREAFTPTDATLIYDEARSLNPSKSENLIIEGENLAVLKLLSNSYREQVKCIYIDPPYNTGKDFVYSDKFNQDKKQYWEDAQMTENGYKIDSNVETDGRFHSNWLNMMYSRLLIARQLLTEDGVIFISIDDNEVHHLRKLCDEVFGEDNFVEQFNWFRSATPPNLSKKSKKNLEYVLCYEKAKNNLKYKGIRKNSKSDDPITKPQNSLKDLVFKKGSINVVKEDSVIKKGTYGTDKFPNELLNDMAVKYGKNDNAVTFRNKFIWLQEKLNEEIENSTTINFSKNGVISYKKAKYDEEVPPNLINESVGVNTTEEAGKQFDELMGARFFDYPKPVSLIKYLLNMNINNNDIILDFFAGSGTTGQAITELNQKDGGNRKYILVQLPEQTSKKSEAYKAGYRKISDITIERNKRVVEKIIKEKNQTTADLFSKKESEQEQLKGLGFKVFKLTKSNFPRVEFAPEPEKTEEENIELLKKYIKDKEAQLVNAFNRDELVTEILIKNGFKLNYTLTKQEEFKKNEILFATDGNKETLICLDVIIADGTVEYFKTHTDQKLIVLERALDTTKKWNLKHSMGDKFNAF